MTATRYASFLLLLALVGLLLAGPAARAQAPAWQSLTSVPCPTGVDIGIAATASGSSGELYVVGAFSGTVTLGATTLTSVGADDIFVARWNESTRTWAWAQRAGGPGNDRPTAVAVNGPNVYLTGSFANTATFGTTTLNATSYAGLFVAKVTSAATAGTWTWALGNTSMFTRYGKAIAVRGNSVYVGGEFEFDSTFGTQYVLGRGGNDGFVAKATDAGPTATWTWAQPVGGGPGGDDEITGVAAGEVDVYVTGNFDSINPTFGSALLAPTGTGRMFAARLVDAGPTASFTWAKVFGELLPSTGFYTRALMTTLVAQGNTLYLIGDYANASLQVGPFTLPNTGIYDSFVLRMTDTGPTGTFDWVQTIGGTEQEIAIALTVSGSSLYVAGVFTSATAVFGTVSLPPYGSSSWFVAKLDDAGTNGTWAWAQRAGGTGSGGASAVSVSDLGTVCVSGSLAVPATFGSLVATSPTGRYATCVATLSPATGLATTAAAPLAGLALYPNPAQRTTTVQLPAGLAAGPATLTLLDALGRVVRTTTVALAAGSSQADFDVASLAPGVYALRVAVAVAGRTGTARLVVE
jgi:hypothetical protein